MKLCNYNITTGTYGTSSYRVIGAYATKKAFVTHLRKLGYERYFGKIKDNETEFAKHFGQYSILILNYEAIEL